MPQVSVWNRLAEGEKTLVGSAAYVCMGWLPISTQDGAHTVVAHMWGECRVCGAGFSAYLSRSNVNAGKATRTCPQHRGRRAHG